MQPYSICLIGEAQKGDEHTLYYCRSLDELYNFLGEPPKETEGLHFAIRSLLLGLPCLYLRVHEEGVSNADYLAGLHLLYNLPQNIPHLGALFMPGVGAHEVIEEGLLVCRLHRSILLISEKDFYDFLTDFTSK